LQIVGFLSGLCDLGGLRFFFTRKKNQNLKTQRTQRKARKDRRENRKNKEST
jgi:hypothetical protein